MLKDMKALFFDLDDTLINFGGVTQAAWELACQVMAEEFSDVSINPLIIAESITKQSDAYYNNEQTRPKGNVDFNAIRAGLVANVFSEYEINNQEAQLFLVNEYARSKEEAIYLLPNVYETLRELKNQDKKLVLITNGDGVRQRGKIERFALAPYFDSILIEGEQGVGKPEQEVYEKALSFCDVDAHEACMVGDNYLWEVEAPIQYGLKGVWANTLNKPRPAESTILPNLTITNVEELLSW